MSSYVVLLQVLYVWVSGGRGRRRHTTVVYSVASPPTPVSLYKIRPPSPLLWKGNTCPKRLSYTLRNALEPQETPQHREIPQKRP